MFNILFLAGFATFLGLVLAIWVSRTPPPESIHLPEEDFDRDPKNERPLTMADLNRLGEKLCEENHVTVKDKLEQEDGEIYWVAESKNELFFGNYVLGFSDSKEPVDLSKIVEFKGFLRGVGSTKGLYLTTGYFARDVHQPLEGSPVALYNRLKVLNELKKHALWPS